MSTVSGALVGVAPTSGPWAAAESAATGTKGYIDSLTCKRLSLAFQARFEDFPARKLSRVRFFGLGAAIELAYIMARQLNR